MNPITREQYGEAIAALEKARRELQKVADEIRNINPDARTMAAAAVDQIGVIHLLIDNQPFQ